MNGWFDRAAQAYTPEDTVGHDSWQLPEPAPESGRWSTADIRRGLNDTTTNTGTGNSGATSGSGSYGYGQSAYDQPAGPAPEAGADAGAQAYGQPGSQGYGQAGADYGVEEPYEPADPLDAHRQLAARQPQIIGRRPETKQKKNGWFRPGR